MQIIKLTAENVKKLRVVEITPDGNVVEITGKNGAGKSSVLDSIEYALAGGRTLPDKPIRDGEKAARIELDLGAILVERTFTKKGSYLTVMKDGEKVLSPQKLLDEICGEISFDPLAFVNEPDPKKQRAVLLELLGVDLEANTAAIKALKGDRTEINRDITRLKGQVAGAEFVEGLPDEEVSAGELAADLQKAADHNQAIMHAKSDAVMANSKIEQMKAAIEEQERILREAKEFVSANPTIDEATLTEKLQTAETTNASIRKNKERQGYVESLKDATANYKAKGHDIQVLEDGKADLLAHADMPVEGLAVDEDGVTFKGIPLAQIASSEKLKVGVAVSMALNPDLRVLKINDGSLLDSDNMKVLGEMVREKDYQVWIEVVDESGEGGIVIEEGQVKDV